MKSIRFVAALAVLLALLVFVAPVGAATTVLDASALQNAFNAGGEVTLGTNIVTTNTLVVPEGKVVTLDLSGFNISTQEETTTYAINNLGTLTLEDSSPGKTGSVNARGIYNGYGNGGDNVATAKIIVESGTYNARGTGGGAAIFNYGIAEINGGTFTSVSSYSLNNQAGASMTIADGVTVTGGIYNTGATLTVNGGDIKNSRSGAHVIYAWNSYVTIKDGNIYNENSGNAAVFAAGTTTMIINGGTFGIKDGRIDGQSNTWTSCLTDTANTATLTVTGGTFNGGFRVQVGTTMNIQGGSFNDIYGSNYNIYGTATVTGGTFTDEAAKTFASTYLGEGCTFGEDGKVTGPTPVAKIESTDDTYSSLQAAINAAQNDDTIILLENIEQADGVLITDKKLTIDLNLKTFNVTEGASTNNRNFKIDGTSEVTIKNGVMFAKGDYSSGAYGTIRTDGTAKVTLTGLKLYNYRGNGMNIKALSGTTVIISDTEIYSQYGGGIEAAGGTVELTNVKVDQKGMYTAPYNSMAISVNGGGTATVHSGTYTTECITADEANNQGTSHGPWAAGVLNSGGTLIINGGTFSNDNFGENSLATAARGLILADTGANIEINGGTFNALKAIIDITNNLGDASNNPYVTLSSGTFSADPRVSGLHASELITVKEGYVCVGPTDGEYTVEEANPQITATPSGVSATLTVGYEQPTETTVTVGNIGNVELTLTITKEGFENITISELPESWTLAASESFSFSVLLDAGLAAGTYTGTITMTNESNNINVPITVSFTVSDSTGGDAPGTTSPGSSGSGSGSGDFQYYPRAVPADGVIDFGTSPVVTGMEVPVGSSGTVTLNTKPTFAMPENGFYIFEIDAPGYNTDAKINGGIAFKISLAKIEEAGWTEKDVVLFHGTVGEDGKITWEALPTNLIKVENGIAYYKAAINGCSPFYIGFVKDGSIVNTEVVDPVTPPTDEPDVPGTDLPDIPGVQDEPEEPSSPAPILAVLAGLGAAVVLRRK